MKTHYTLITILLISSINSYASDLPGGDEIARRINARDEGLAVARHLTMEMTDRRGKQRKRETRAFRKYFGEEKRTVIFYQSPNNIKNTAFLTYDYPQAAQDDDQWLYLPAMRKVRRISASDRGDYFLGTDFTYEDIKLETRVSMQDYRRKTIGESEVDGFHCLLLESVPVDEDTAAELGYSRVEQCVDDSIWMVRQAKMWDLQGRPLKTITFSDIRRVQDIWTQHELQVNNHKTGHHTRFIFSDVHYNNAVQDRLFTQSALKRGL